MMGKKELYTPSRDNRPWWQFYDADQFRNMLSTMSIARMEELYAEISDAVDVLHTQLQTREDSSTDWRNRAKTALAFISEKQKLTSTALKARRRDIESRGIPRKKYPDVVLPKLKKQAEKGETNAAVVGLLDWLMKKESA